MTTTEQFETVKSNIQSSANNIRWGLSGRVIFGTFVALAALFLVGMLPRWRSSAALETSVRDQRRTVSVVSPQRPDEAANLVLPGSTQAIQETAIYPRTNGYVHQWFVDIGGRVEGGQLLAEIETPEVDQELNQARAAAEQASANADLARATLTRWQELLAKKVVSSQEFDEKKAAAEARHADLSAAQANVQRLEKLQGFQKVMSPFSGIVTARGVDNGALVSAGSNGQSAPLFRVAQTDTLRIYVTVPQTQARTIVAGQSATVSVREIPDKTFDAKVIRTSGALDPASRTLLTELQVPNPIAGLISVLPAATVDKYDERHVLLFGRNVKVKLLLRSASIHIRNVGNPGDTVPSSRIGLLSYRADLCVCGRDRREKTANENRRRIKNRGPPELEKVPVHNRGQGMRVKCFCGPPKSFLQRSA
jgi:RND family efflux transporter MFP subunit